MPTRDPVTGPLSRETLKELAASPHGIAVKTIRRFDPQWGRAEGEKFRWKVTGRQDSHVYAFVMAANQKEADKLADELDDNDFETGGWCEIVVEKVEPDKE